MKKWFGLILVTFMVGLAIWGLVDGSKATEKKVNADLQEARQMQATDFELPTLTGEQMKLSDTRGKKVVLNFWASWCGPCKDEAPHLQSFYEENKESVEIIAVNITSQDRISDVQQFVEDYGLTFPILMDKTGDVSMMYGAFTIPTTLFLNEKGEIVEQFVGPMNEDFIQSVITEM